MSYTITEPPRIVCTKCVRIVRVHSWDTDPFYGGIFIATECCQRVAGFLDGEFFAAQRSRTRDITLDDIKPAISDDYESDLESRIKRAQVRLDAIRWAKGKP